MRHYRIMAFFVFCVAALGFGAESFAARTCFQITNNSGAARSDLHLEMAGTGGTATLTVTVNAPGCAAPSSVSNPGAPWDIIWPAACIDAGETVTVTVVSSSAVTFSSGLWTPGDVALAPEDVVIVDCVPAVSTWGLAVLLLLVVTAASVALRRRSAVV